MAHYTHFGAFIMLNAFIIDDEPLAHLVIQHHLAAHPTINIVGQYYSAKDALYDLAKLDVDLVFLDINMPELSGLELLKALAKPPQVIIVSAYQEYAFEGFELNVTDYLLKPVSAERLEQALNKVIIRENQFSTQPQSSIILKVDREKRKVNLDSIEYIEAYGNYVKVHLADQVILATSTLKRLSVQLDGSFLQTHKSFLINKNKVVAVSNDYIELISGTIVKVGKSYKEVSRSLL